VKLQEKTKEKESVLLWIVLCIISSSLILLFNIEKEYSYVIIIKTILINVILNSVLTFFIVEKQIKSEDVPYFNSIIFGSYISSFLLMLCTKGKIEYHIWMFGSIVISTVIYVNLGYIVLFQHVLIASLFGNYRTEQVICLLIFGIVLCILAKYMKERKLLKYIIMIVVSLDLILKFVINDFLISYILGKEVLLAIILDVILVLTTYIISSYYDSIVIEEGKKKTLEKEDIKTTVLLDEFIKQDFRLLKELNSYSHTLYERSRKAGKISYLAAKEIGANEKLALAGGLYHDIGRMRDGDYVQQGIELIKKYNMPSEIGDMINQHNVKYAKPTSPEAAIVMLTISILATKDILEKKAIQNNGVRNSDIKNSMSMKKIVENVFDMRLSKRSLDDSGLTIYQFNHLKDFYTTEILSIIES
jgi:putative nucleotidyltransferase with HDIG domain